MTRAAERGVLSSRVLPRWPIAAGPSTAPLDMPAAKPAMAAVQGIAGWTILSSATIPLLLTIPWLVADALQPSSYSPVRQTISVLAGHAATDRWIMTAALYLVGAAYLATAAGMRGVGAVARGGLVVAALTAFSVASLPEPVHGSSRAHAVCAAIGAVTLAVWPALAAGQDSVLAAVGARRCMVAITVSVLLLLWTVVETRNGSHLGLAERVSTALQVTWPCVVARSLRRRAMALTPATQRQPVSMEADAGSSRVA